MLSKMKILHINATPEFLNNPEKMELINKMCETAYNMKIKYNINGVTFLTDKSVQEFAKIILYKDSINSVLSEDDFNFMYCYFKEIHHEWEQKLGVGIKCIHRVADKLTGKYRAFEIERVDGSFTDISYIVSNIKTPKLINDFKKALRNVVNQQILEFKTSFFQFPITKFCEISGDVITFSNCHVDHFNPSFNDLVNLFIEENKINDLSNVLEPSKDNQTMCFIKDSEIANKFYEYHLINANLRVLSVKANLSIPKK